MCFLAMAAFMDAVRFLAAASMVEDPVAEGSLDVCSNFVAFSRTPEDAHYPWQALLGWYLAFASAVAVNDTDQRFANIRVTKMPISLCGDGTGMGLETRW